MIISIPDVSVRASCSTVFTVWQIGCWIGHRARSLAILLIFTYLSYASVLGCVKGAIYPSTSSDDASERYGLPAGKAGVSQIIIRGGSRFRDEGPVGVVFAYQ